jgi:hypothetical protein
VPKRRECWLVFSFQFPRFTTYQPKVCSLQVPVSTFAMNSDAVVLNSTAALPWPSRRSMTSSIIPGVLTVHVSEKCFSRSLSMLTALQTVKRRFRRSFQAPFSHILGDNYFGNFSCRSHLQPGYICRWTNWRCDFYELRRDIKSLFLTEIWPALDGWICSISFAFADTPLHKICSHWAITFMR